MIILDRLSLPLEYEPKVGDILRIKSIKGGSRGRWWWELELLDAEAVRQALKGDGNDNS